MSATLVDTSYRTWSFETLYAVRSSTLLQLKSLEGVGQSHSVNGRQTTLADQGKLVATLSNIEAALDWKLTRANQGNKGFASRYSGFNGCD